MTHDFTKAPRVVLRKRDDETWVSYEGRSPDEITVTTDLTWLSGVGGPNKKADLDQYALMAGSNYPAKTGVGRMLAADTSVVYYKNKGSRRRAPFVKLLGDSKTAGSEKLQITRLSTQGFVALPVYQQFNNGVGAFSEFEATVTITDDLGTRVVVPLTETHRNRYWVVVAVLDFRDPRGYKIRKVEQYGAPKMEERPVLNPDGSIVMDAGPREFKRR